MNYFDTRFEIFMAVKIQVCVTA